MAARLALKDAVQGARHVVETYTWPGNLALTGATLTGTKRKKYETAVTTIDGTLTPDADQVANPGMFTWDYGAGDVGTAGEFFVQLKATFTDFDATIQSRWIVHGLQSASAVAGEALVGIPEGDADWLADEKAGVETADNGEVLESNGTNSRGSGVMTADVALTADVLPKDAGLLAKIGAYELAAGDGGKVIRCDGTFTVTLPDGLADGLQAMIANVGTGVITMAAETTLQGIGTQLTTQWAACYVVHLGDGIWEVYGGAV